MDLEKYENSPALIRRLKIRFTLSPTFWFAFRRKVIKRKCFMFICCSPFSLQRIWTSRRVSYCEITLCFLRKLFLLLISATNIYMASLLRYAPMERLPANVCNSGDCAALEEVDKEFRSKFQMKIPLWNFHLSGSFYPEFSLTKNLFHKTGENRKPFRYLPSRQATWCDI